MCILFIWLGIFVKTLLFKYCFILLNFASQNIRKNKINSIIKNCTITFAIKKKVPTVTSKLSVGPSLRLSEIVCG